MRELIVRAMEARERAYAPYSHFLVGAALLTGSGRIYGGCNVENASYGASNCAERTAFFRALYEGEQDFQAIAIVGKREDRGEFEFCAPCGICRQVMMEFCDPKAFQIILARTPEDYQIYTLDELLPVGFGGGSLK